MSGCRVREQEMSISGRQLDRIAKEELLKEIWTDFRYTIFYTPKYTVANSLAFINHTKEIHGVNN